MFPRKTIIYFSFDHYSNRISAAGAGDVASTLFAGNTNDSLAVFASHILEFLEIFDLIILKFEELHDLISVNYIFRIFSTAFYHFFRKHSVK